MPRICLVSSGLFGPNARLQPWRYLQETARGLARNGHTITLLTDSLPTCQYPTTVKPEPNNINILSLPSIRSWRGRRNRMLKKALLELQPDVVLWHVGLTSFLHQDFCIPAGTKGIGIFTSPIYDPGELFRLQIPNLLTDPSLSLLHLVSSMIPRHFIRHGMKYSGLKMLVTETKTTAQRLLRGGFWKGPLQVIAPGVDELWCQDHSIGGLAFRKALNFTDREKLILYLGSSAPLRGLPVLLRAFRMANAQRHSLRLLILLRDKGAGGDRMVNPAIESLRQFEADVRVINGLLDAEQVALYMAASDLVVLPFVLVPSDAPLSILEAQALGKPVITTRISCLPELAEKGRTYLAEPGNEYSLADLLLRLTEENLILGPASEPRTWVQTGKEWSHLVDSL